MFIRSAVDLAGEREKGFQILPETSNVLFRCHATSINSHFGLHRPPSSSTVANSAHVPRRTWNGKYGRRANFRCKAWLSIRHKLTPMTFENLPMTSKKLPWTFEKVIRRKIYDPWILPWLRYLLPQRLRRYVLGVPIYLWGYRKIFLIKNLSMREKAYLIRRFLKIDINTQHAHQACEIVAITDAFFTRRAYPGEIMVEAGCWQGGSSAKFSILCKLQGYELHIYDSFEGVEETDQDGHDFSGEYAASEDLVVRNITRFGEISVCRLIPGWFVDTLAAQGIGPFVVRLVYIDCDLAKGTNEVLQGVMPSLSSDGIIFSQDYQIPVVRQLLHDSDTWRKFARPLPVIRPCCHNLVKISFEQ